mmetsp:Transcript_25193/g.35296  ORF Transcript_25193/g.35296 Transcript_25193/m.35296 type:complete len:591 (+) Transcript_25193:74-1846(+)
MDNKTKDLMDTDANAEVESSDSDDDAVEEGKSNKQQADDDDEQPEEAPNTDPVVDPRALKPFTGDSLPYDLSSLTWDASHRRNKQNKYCYCGNPRSQWTVMLKCASCKQWFHIECLKKRPAHPPLIGDNAYTFKCCICTKSDSEYCELLGKSWTDIVRVAIYNLLLLEKKKGNANPRKFFQYKEEICNYIDKHWESLCHGKTRTKTWENTIGSSLSTKSHYFASGGELLGQPGFWGLKSEADPSTFTKSGSGAAKKDKSKKKLPKGSAAPKKKRDALSFLPDDLPSRPQKQQRKPPGIPAPAPVMLPKQFFDAKSYGYTRAMLAKENSAPQVKIGSDNLTVSNEKGYRMARASAGVSEGSWYFEIEVLPHGGNTRLGWCTEKGDVQAPVGFDIYSYSYRDKLGTKFHQSRGREYADGYGVGDVLGFYINLPPKKDNANVHQKDSQPPQVIVAPSGKKQQEPDRLIGSEIVFFKNGVNQGIAFSNIYEGTYYPAASLYMGGMVKFNFGPNFKFPPKDMKYRPISDMEEQMKADVAEAARLAKQEAEAAAQAAAAQAAAPTSTPAEGTSNNNNETNGAAAAAPAEVKPEVKS